MRSGGASTRRRCACSRGSRWRSMRAASRRRSWATMPRSSAPLPDRASGAASRRAARARLVAARLAMPAGERARAQAAIEQALAARAPPGRHAVVGGYWPMRGEVDPLPYLRQALAAGATAALPAVVARGAPLEFRAWTPDVRMESDAWDILHPAEGPAVAPQALLIPL